MTSPTERPAGQDAATEQAPQAGQELTAAPSQEGHAAGPAVAAPSADLRGRLDNSAYGSKICREAAAALAELEQAVKQRDTLLGIAERRSEDLRELLKEALPFVDTNPDLHRIGGDELRERIEREIGGGNG